MPLPVPAVLSVPENCAPVLAPPDEVIVVAPLVLTDPLTVNDGVDADLPDPEMVPESEIVTVAEPVSAPEIVAVHVPAYSDVKLC